MIVSAEDGEALGDLKPFIREVMAGLEVKLGTKVDWIAVDHHDTDNPHTHVLIRGRRPDGRELFIPSRLIASGIREHAQEIVTRALGTRLDVDLVRERAAEIELRAPTSLDRELVRSAQGAAVWPERPDLAKRLEVLERLGLANREAGAWQIADRLVPKLQAIADVDDLEHALAPLRARREPAPLLEADPKALVTGELVHLRTADGYPPRSGQSFSGCSEARWQGQLVPGRGRQDLGDEASAHAAAAAAAAAAVVGACSGRATEAAGHRRSCTEGRPDHRRDRAF